MKRTTVALVVLAIVCLVLVIRVGTLTARVNRLERDQQALTKLMGQTVEVCGELSNAMEKLHKYLITRELSLFPRPSEED